MNDMKRYVCTYVRNGEMALFIRKAKPDWQKGKLNLVGGHVEEGESFPQAAVRELKEETDLEAWGLKPEGTIRGTSKGEEFIVQVYSCNATGPGKQMTVEPIEWHRPESFALRTDIIPNLRVIVPLLAFECPFTIIDNGDGKLILENV